MPSAFVKSWELAVDRDSHGSTPHTRTLRPRLAARSDICPRCSRTRLVEKRTPVPVRGSHRPRVGPLFPYPKGPWRHRRYIYGNCSVSKIIRFRLPEQSTIIITRWTSTPNTSSLRTTPSTTTKSTIRRPSRPCTRSRGWSSACWGRTTRTHTGRTPNPATSRTRTRSATTSPTRSSRTRSSRKSTCARSSPPFPSTTAGRSTSCPSAGGRGTSPCTSPGPRRAPSSGRPSPGPIPTSPPPGTRTPFAIIRRLNCRLRAIDGRKLNRFFFVGEEKQGPPRLWCPVP